MVAQEEDRDLAPVDGPIHNHDLGYPIVIGTGLRAEIVRFVRGRETTTIVLSDADPRVRRIAAAVAASLRLPGDAVLGVALGEPRKRLTTVEAILERLAAAAVDRRSLILGVGGGVAADTFGFAAATYMRGTAYAHVATSLVAMVDAAIGGKTGVNLKGGKNLAGAFRDPVAVFCDVEALRSLPFRCVREGLAEIVKAGIIEGGELFDALETLAPHPFSKWPWTSVVAAAVNVKTAIVADDRQEAGMRELLNLGHTFAHGIERASAYRTSHGAAVAIGLRAAGLLALRTGRFSERDHLRVLALLALLQLPLRTRFQPEDVLDAMRSDKKRRGGSLRFVLPRAIGDVEYGVGCDERNVRAVLERLVRPPEAVAR